MYCLCIIGSTKSIHNRVSAIRGFLIYFEVYGEMIGTSQMFVISCVSAVDGCPLSRVPLYTWWDECGNGSLRVKDM